MTEVVEGGTLAWLQLVFIISPPTMSTEQNPYEPPKTDGQDKKPKKEINPYWGRPTLLDWYSSAGLRGRLGWMAGVFLVFNGVTYLCGFYFPKMLIVAIVVLVVCALAPASMDD